MNIIFWILYAKNVYNIFLLIEIDQHWTFHAISFFIHFSCFSWGFWYFFFKMCFSFLSGSGGFTPPSSDPTINKMCVFPKVSQTLFCEPVPGTFCPRPGGVVRILRVDLRSGSVDCTFLQALKENGKSNKRLLLVGNRRKISKENKNSLWNQQKNNLNKREKTTMKIIWQIKDYTRMIVK